MSALAYLRDGYHWLADPYGFLDAAQRRHGLTFRVRLPVLGEALMTGDPRLIAGVVAHPDLDAGKAVSALRAVLGSRSLIMLDGEEHAARHRLIAPLFRGEAARAYDELTTRLTEEAIAALAPGQAFSAYEFAQRVGLKAMVAVMFGQGAAVAAEAERKVARFLNTFSSPLLLFLPALRLNRSWTPWGRAMRHREELCELVRREARLRSASPREGPILDRLAASGLAEEDLVEEVLGLLLFGHDTAAATLAWAFAHVFGDAAALARLRDEGEGPFLEACLSESMRLCPVVVHLSRTASADCRVGEHEVRRGSKVIPCTYLAQHDPEVFPEPHAFRPERFLDGRRYEHSYFPFGFGRRTCAGRPFALRQMQVVLGTAVRSGALGLAPGYRPVPKRHLVLVIPRGGALMRRA